MLLAKINIFTKVFELFRNIFNAAIDWVLELCNSFALGLGTFISQWLLSMGLTVEIPANLFDVLNDFTRGVGYIIPFSALMPIVNFMLSFYVVKIIFAVYKIIANTTIKRVDLKIPAAK